MLLRIELYADLANELLLRLEKIDVMFLVLEEPVVEFLADVIRH